MTSDVWLSVGLGTGIGVMYGVLALAGYRYALRFRGNRFMAFALGGMLARMVLLFVMVLAVAMLLPLHATSFTISLVVVVVISLILEVMTALRWLQSTEGS